MPVDHSGIGSAYRDESEKAFVKATATGLVLIMAHLLGIQPSEITALGLRLEIKSPYVVYGFIALLFGHYISRAMIKADSGQALYPFRQEPLKMRLAIQTIRRQHNSDKIKKRNPLTPQKLKSSVRRVLVASDVAVIPYYTVVTILVIVATGLMIYDIWNFVNFIYILYLH